ncbi:MarR family winged helix-turn-helix transcriptional regulator [Nonomuraea aurantiaca]|uniref:MarR family winged helix-turn-helix transcriptional regulator n=1 Tax=Nonomuraea aurantiaca TaxID=2878562 RepID=UPI001CD99CFD|nr:MarR family transcriptional regulator [Nonomuraea aurantiaca]MCA2226004.1 MarR family transcriptional regulator [Nonomuraea aurantiaca]
MSEGPLPEGNGENREDLSAVVAAVLTGSRLLVAIAVRSLGAVGDKVTLPQFRMLVVLAGHGATKLVAMAELLNVNPSTAMRMADRLAAARLIVREVNPRDRRESLMRLTDEGQHIVDQVTARRGEEITAIIARMPAEQRRALLGAMTAFTEAGGEPPESALHPLGWPDV